MSLQIGLTPDMPPLGVVLAAMVGVHVLIGIGEALITVAALAFIGVTRADLFELRDRSPQAA